MRLAWPHTTLPRGTEVLAGARGGAEAAQGAEEEEEEEE